VKEEQQGGKHPLIIFAEKGKRIVAGVLLLMMFGVLAFAVVELLWLPLSLMIPALPGPEGELVMSEAELLGIFGMFLSVLIALELVETVEVYFRDSEVHAEIVILVAMIALARKVVLIDLHEYPPATVLGLSGLFIGLAASYVAIKWARRIDPHASAE
jgi:uncharacterized membrane protein (DUF373 family)